MPIPGTFQEPVVYLYLSVALCLSKTQTPNFLNPRGGDGSRNLETRELMLPCMRSRGGSSQSSEKGSSRFTVFGERLGATVAVRAHEATSLACCGQEALGPKSHHESGRLHVGMCKQTLAFALHIPGDSTAWICAAPCLICYLKPKGAQTPHLVTAKARNPNSMQSQNNDPPQVSLCEIRSLSWDPATSRLLSKHPRLAFDAGLGSKV